MRRIVIWLASTVTVVVLLFGYHTSTSATTALGASEAASPPSASSGGSASPSSPAPSTATRSSAPSIGSKTYTGSVAQTRWGPVQVEITVAAGKVTKVDVVEYPSGNPKDAEINAYALPILVQDTIKAQSAKIDMVSGATVTSTGYLQSLQAALDDAGL